MRTSVWSTTTVSLSYIFVFEIVMCFTLVFYVRIAYSYKTNVIKNENEMIEFRELSRGEVHGIAYVPASENEGVY